MSLASEMMSSMLVKRDLDYICRDGRRVDRSRDCYSGWTYWGRWVFLAVAVVVFVLALAALGCISSRRRRRAGAAPYYGTGWMAPPKYSGNNNPNQYQPPPPQYSAQPGQGQYQYPAQNQYPVQNQYTGQTFNPNDGYYGAPGANQEGIQLQQPAHSYQRGPDAENAYAPRPGPPPNKA